MYYYNPYPKKTLTPQKMPLVKKYTSSKLEESIDKLGLQQFDVKADGDCLFHSLVFLFKDQTVTSKDIRKKMVDYICENSEIYEYITVMGGYGDRMHILREELEYISNPKTYDVPIFDLFPVIIASAFQIELQIYPWQSNDENDIGITECDMESYMPLNPSVYVPIIKLLYVDGIHYKPMAYVGETDMKLLPPEKKKRRKNY